MSLWGLVIPAAIKGDNAVVPNKADSNIPSDQVSEQLLDTLSWTGKWTDSDEEQLCDLGGG